MDLTMIAGAVAPVLYGAFAGAVCGLAPFMKKKLADPTLGFDKTKLFNTSVYGAIVGVIAVVQGVPYEQALNILTNLTPFLAAVGLVHLTQNGTKAVKAELKTLKEDHL